MREQCERLARAMKLPAPSDPHSPSSEFFIPKDQLESLVDVLFGTRYVESTLYFRDARIRRRELSRTLVISRTAMSRGLGTVREKHLFQTEYAEGTVLETSVTGWHRDLAVFDEGYLPYAYFFLLMGIGTVDRLGGDKSTGKGRCKMHVTRVVYNGQTLDPSHIDRQQRDIAEMWEYYVEEKSL